MDSHPQIKHNERSSHERVKPSVQRDFNLLFRAHYMTWRSSMSRWELFCLSQAFNCELSFSNENSKKHCSLFRRNDAKCRWKSSMNFHTKVQWDFERTIKEIWQFSFAWLLHNTVYLFDCHTCKYMHKSQAHSFSFSPFCIYQLTSAISKKKPCNLSADLFSDFN